MRRPHGQNALQEHTLYHNQGQQHSHRYGAQQHHNGVQPYYAPQQGSHQAGARHDQQGLQQAWQRMPTAANAAPMAGHMRASHPNPAQSNPYQAVPYYAQQPGATAARQNPYAPAIAVHHTPQAGMAVPGAPQHNPYAPQQRNPHAQSSVGQQSGAALAAKYEAQHQQQAMQLNWQQEQQLERHAHVHQQRELQLQAQDRKYQAQLLLQEQHKRALHMQQQEEQQRQLERQAHVHQQRELQLQAQERKYQAQLLLQEQHKQAQQQQQPKHKPVVYFADDADDAEAEEAPQQPAKRQRLDPGTASTTAQSNRGNRAPTGTASPANTTPATAADASRLAAAAAVRAAAVAPSTPAAAALGPSTQQFYAELSAEVAAFAAAVTPTAAEVERRRAKFEVMEQVVRACLPTRNGTVRAQLFGSEAAGMATHESDLDVVVTGLAEPVDGAFDDHVKAEVVRMLRRLEQGMRQNSQLDVYRSFVIKKARTPIIKCQLGDGLHLDVSINSDSGPKAAAYTQRMMKELSALRPLVLLLKSMLKQLNLADVAIGGLGGWSLINMVIAHLKESRRKGLDTENLGHMLHSFLLHYGFGFSYEAMAVAPGREVCFQPKSYLAMSEHGYKLCIEDPLTGRNVSGGSHRIAYVSEAFQTAARALSNAMQSHAMRSGTGGHADGSSTTGSTADGNGSCSSGLGLEEGERSTPLLPAPQLDAPAGAVGMPGRAVARQHNGSGAHGSTAQEWRLLTLVLDVERAATRSARGAGADGGYQAGHGHGGNYYAGSGGWQGQQAGHKRQREAW